MEITWLIGSVPLCRRWQLRSMVVTKFNMPGTACNICADSKDQHIYSFSQCGSNIPSPRPGMWQTPLKNNVLRKTQELYGSQYNVVGRKIWFQLKLQLHWFDAHVEYDMSSPPRRSRKSFVRERGTWTLYQYPIRSSYRKISWSLGDAR